MTGWTTRLLRPRQPHHLPALLCILSLASPGPSIAQDIAAIRPISHQVRWGPPQPGGAPRIPATPNVGPTAFQPHLSSLELSLSVTEVRPLYGSAIKPQAPALTAKTHYHGTTTARPLSGFTRPTGFDRLSQTQYRIPRPATPSANLSLREILSAAAQALRGTPNAIRSLPGFGRLGSAPPISSSGDPDSDRAAAEASFRWKASIEDASDSESGTYPETSTVSIPPRRLNGPDSQSVTLASRTAGSRGHRATPPPQQPQPPKYPFRKIRLHEAILPSAAFSPDRPLEPLIIQAIDAAQTSIHIALYEFKSREILKALRRARQRDVQVHLLVDYSNIFPRKRPDSDRIPHRSEEMQSLIDEGFDVRVLRGLWRFGSLHAKFMVFDEAVAQFGSFNYSWTAQFHHENIRFTDDPKRVQARLRFWEYMSRVAVPFSSARDHAWPKELAPPPADPNPSVKFNGLNLPAWVFSPGGNAEEWIVKAIEAARETIDISMFSFRSTRIAEALVNAKKRKPKLKIRIILDSSQFDENTVRPYGLWLAHHRIPVRIQAGPDPNAPEGTSKNHNKLMVADGNLVATGSTNWTENAFLMNFENLDFSTEDSGAYASYFEDLFQAAKPLPRPSTEPTLPKDEALVRELQVELEPAPPPPNLGTVPPPPTVEFHGTPFPEYAFRPHHPIRERLIKAIDLSQKSIYLSLYQFDLLDVAQALIRAKERGGVDIHILLDYTYVFPRGTDHTGHPRQRSPAIQAILDEAGPGLEIRIIRGFGPHGTNHNKYAVFDEEMAEFGSYNWAETAEENHFENGVFTTERPRTDFYLKLWNWQKESSATVAEAPTYDWSGRALPQAPRDPDWALELNGVRFPRTAASPQGGIESLLISAIGAARDSIEIAMFGFYSQPIAEALLKAKRRFDSANDRNKDNPNWIPKTIRILLDEAQAQRGKLDQWFSYYGFDVRITAGPDPDANVKLEKMHHKFMLIDGKWLATGSFNYSSPAELQNFENVGFFTSPGLVVGFRSEFENRFKGGWKPRKPKSAPESKPLPSDFFDPLRDFHAE